MPGGEVGGQAGDGAEVSAAASMPDVGDEVADSGARKPAFCAADSWHDASVGVCTVMAAAKGSEAAICINRFLMKEDLQLDEV